MLVYVGSADWGSDWQIKKQSKTMSAKARADTTKNVFCFFFIVLYIYLGWRNQPPSDIMENLDWKRLYIRN